MGLNLDINAMYMFSCTIIFLYFYLKVTYYIQILDYLNNIKIKNIFIYMKK